MKDFIKIYERQVPAQLCDDLIQIFDNFDFNNQVFNRTDKMKADSKVIFFEEAPIRQNIKQALFNALRPSVEDYFEEYQILKSMPEIFINHLKIQKMLPGEGYHNWHCEVTNANHGARVLNYQVYLNDVEEGGETEFLYMAKRVKPSKGTILLNPPYYTHTHRGNPPLSGAKYIANGWLEFK